MLSNIKLFFAIWRQYAKMDILWFLRDTRYCLIYIFADTVAAVASVTAVMLVGARFGGIGGMSSDQILFMSGYAVLTDGILMMFFGGSNISYISRTIGRGQLDHMLIQPVPIPIQLLAGGFQPLSGCSKLIVGIILTVTAVCRLKLHITAGWLVGLVLSLVCSTTVILAFIYILSCCAFFAPVAAEEIAGTVHELFNQTKYYPLGGLSQAGLAALCTVIPVGIAAWFPSNVLLGQTPSALPAILTGIVAAAFFTVAALLFRKGITYYEKSGSTRYTGFGHR